MATPDGKKTKEEEAAVGREIVLCRSCFREVSFTQHYIIKSIGRFYSSR